MLAFHVTVLTWAAFGRAACTANSLALEDSTHVRLATQMP
jgi:hypothetical protein